MRAALSNRLEGKAAFFPARADSAQQLGHCGIIRHEQPFSGDCQRKVQVSNFEGDPDRLLLVAGMNS